MQLRARFETGSARSACSCRTAPVMQPATSAQEKVGLGAADGRLQQHSSWCRKGVHCWHALKQPNSLNSAEMPSDWLTPLCCCLFFPAGGPGGVRRDWREAGDPPLQASSDKALELGRPGHLPVLLRSCAVLLRHPRHLHPQHGLPGVSNKAGQAVTAGGVWQTCGVRPSCSTWGPVLACLLHTQLTMRRCPAYCSCPAAMVCWC